MSRAQVIISNYDSPGNPYYHGGGASMVHFVAKSLARQFDITVLTAAYPGSRNGPASGVNYRFIGFPFLGPRLGQLWFHFLLPFYALRLRYDLWVESFTPPFSTSLLPLFTRRPVIGLAHALTGKLMSQKYGLPFAAIEKWGLQFYPQLIILNPGLEKQLSQAYPSSRIYLVPNGVAVPPKTSVSPSYILYVGRIALFEKGLSLLLSAYHSIVNQTQAPLIIAGSGSDSEMEQLKRTIAGLGLSRRVKITGWADRPTLNRLLAKCLFMVSPSREESFGLSVLEAFSFGKPALVYDIAGFSWIPGSCALKVRPFSVSGLAQGMLSLLKSPPLRRRLGIAARKVAAEYSLSKIPRRYAQIFRQVLREQKIAPAAA